MHGVLYCRVSALDCGEQAASWISNFLNRTCRLIEHHKQDGRTCKLGGSIHNSSRIVTKYQQWWKILQRGIHLKDMFFLSSYAITGLQSKDTKGLSELFQDF